MNFTREDIKKDTEEVVGKAIVKAFDDFAVIMKQSFDSIDGRFDGVDSQLHEMRSDIKDVKADVRELKLDMKEVKFQLTETVHRPEFIELKQRVDKLEQKPA